MSDFGADVNSQAPLNYSVFTRQVQLGRSTISGGVTIEGDFEEKTRQEGHQRGLFLARRCPGSPGTCTSEETGLPVLPVS